MTEPDIEDVPDNVIETDPLMKTVADVLRMQAARTMAAPVPAAILTLIGSVEAFRG